MHVDTLNAYQTASRKTWSLIHTDHAIVYPTLGLTNEAGEVAGKIKKIFRDRAGVISDADREALKYELGEKKGQTAIRFVAYDEEGRIEQRPLIVNEREVTALRKEIARSPRLKALLRRLVED